MALLSLSMHKASGRLPTQGENEAIYILKKNEALSNIICKPSETPKNLRLTLKSYHAVSIFWLYFNYRSFN